MNRHILCTWLGLPDHDWPPDHRLLLGLQPGQEDPAQIEQSVHERLAKLRCYQLSHPEEATEGMNRLAQAYIFLTEELARKTCPSLSQPICPASPNPPAETASTTTQTNGTDQDWQATTPPVRTAPQNASPTVEQGGPYLATQVVPSTQAPSAPCPPPIEAPDLIIELAQHSREARRGLGTLAKLIGRIDHTRQLLIAWKKAGAYLSKPRRKITKLNEERDLERRLNNVFEQIQDYPGFVGQPGHPGYRVVAMARLEMTALMFKTLDSQQRQHLAKDWKAGYAVLLSHRKFLRQRFKTMRREGIHLRALRALRASINDHPLRATFLLSLAGGVCLFSYFFWF
jgi:hypothetical protein